MSGWSSRGLPGTWAERDASSPRGIGLKCGCRGDGLTSWPGERYGPTDMCPGCTCITVFGRAEIAYRSLQAEDSRLVDRPRQSTREIRATSVKEKVSPVTRNQAKSWGVAGRTARHVWFTGGTAEPSMGADERKRTVKNQLERQLEGEVNIPRRTAEVDLEELESKFALDAEDSPMGAAGEAQSSSSGSVE